MSQFIEFKVVNTKLMNMGGGDPVKQMEERTAYLDKIRKEAEERDKSGKYQYNASSNPFPEWVRNIIKELAVEKRSKAKFDDENSVFRVKIGGGRDDFDEFYNEYDKRINKVLADDKEKNDWFAENFIQVTSSPDDEMIAMNDLESHMRGMPLPVSRKVTEKDE